MLHGYHKSSLLRCVCWYVARTIALIRLNGKINTAGNFGSTWELITSTKENLIVTIIVVTWQRAEDGSQPSGVSLWSGTNGGKKGLAYGTITASIGWSLKAIVGFTHTV